MLGWPTVENSGPSGSVTFACAQEGETKLSSVGEFALAFSTIPSPSNLGTGEDEEIGNSADAALPLALWTFPIVFLGSLVGSFVGRARPGAR
jgi:hypothetical protein